MTPSAWWGMYGGHLPLLAHMAKVVLSQVVSASTAERNWSVYGKIQSARMGHEVSDKRVYCHEALHLKEKLQNANYKVKVEKWVSDSESGEESSDEEDYKV
eukprot:5530092-Prymnesium_polylepis.2